MAHAMIDTINAMLRQRGAAFALGDRVRHLTQTEGKPGVVTAVIVVAEGFRYLVAFEATDNAAECSGLELEPAEDDGWID